MVDISGVRSAVNAYNRASNINNSTEVGGGSSSAAVDFSNSLRSVSSGVLDSLRGAEHSSTLALMKRSDITDVVSAVTNAELTLKTVVAIRDRLVASLQDIMKMPI